ncbi:unnamed protein product, partial [marine sediment metagenome]
PQRASREWETPKSNTVNLGADNSQLGPGWYLMHDEGDRHYRWFAKEASLSLAAPQEKGCSLRIVTGNDYYDLKKVGLHVLVDDEEIAHLFPEEGWNTYRFPLPGAGRDHIRLKLWADDLYSADYTGELTDLSFKVKEVAVE